MIVATAAIPEMVPNATTLSTQCSGCSCSSICAGSSSCMGVSWAIQIANQIVANEAIQPVPTRRVGSARAPVAASVVGRAGRVIGCRPFW